jgi:hypothetical protein
MPEVLACSTESGRAVNLLQGRVFPTRCSTNTATGKKVPAGGAA